MKTDIKIPPKVDLIEIVGIKWPKMPALTSLFGHVVLIQGYTLPDFRGCHAVLSLRDTPGKYVILLSAEPGIQSLLESALQTGNVIQVRGNKYADPPNPGGGIWSFDVYGADSVVLYNMK